MLRSMTGFGRCLVENTHTIQQWEIKSVNSRHLDLKWRLPLAVRSLEPRLEKVVRRFASRGRVDISLILQYAPGDAPAMRFDASQANAMRAARAEWEKLQRGVAEFQITLAIGRPELYPEQPTTVRGFKPQIDEADWLLTQVVHDLTNQGYTNRVQLEVKLEELPE